MRVWLGYLCERELAGGVDPQRVVDGVGLLVLGDDEAVETRTLLLHHLTQIVGAIDAHTVLVGRRIV